MNFWLRKQRQKDRKVKVGEEKAEREGLCRRSGPNYILALISYVTFHSFFISKEKKYPPHRQVLKINWSMREPGYGLTINQ